MSKLATVKARDGAVLVPLLEGEMGRLIRTGNPVNARFGTGGAALVASEAKWALPLLAEWRGIAFQNGAGI